MPLIRTTQHVVEEKLRKEYQDKFFKTILTGTLDESSPLSKIRSYSGTLQIIFHFAGPSAINEKAFFYKIRLVTCAGTEGVHLEALNHPRFSNGGFGSLSNQLHCGSSRFIMSAFLRQYAWAKNDEQEFCNEGQLRALYKTFSLARYCGAPTGQCKGACGALPGDTVYWSDAESFKYQPATQEDIVERGYLGYGPGGLLVAQARLARTDPSQLEGESDEEDNDE
jgi:hypothetical protein